jgi:hypothetical protein
MTDMEPVIAEAGHPPIARLVKVGLDWRAEENAPQTRDANGPWDIPRCADEPDDPTHQPRKRTSTRTRRGSG